MTPSWNRQRKQGQPEPPREGGAPRFEAPNLAPSDNPVFDGVMKRWRANNFDSKLLTEWEREVLMRNQKPPAEPEPSSVPSGPAMPGDAPSDVWGAVDATQLPDLHNCPAQRIIKRAEERTDLDHVAMELILAINMERTGMPIPNTWHGYREAIMEAGIAIPGAEDRIPEVYRAFVCQLARSARHRQEEYGPEKIVDLELWETDLLEALPPTWEDWYAETRRMMAVIEFSVMSMGANPQEWFGRIAHMGWHLGVVQVL